MKLHLALCSLTFLFIAYTNGQWITLTGPEGKPVSVTLCKDTPTATVIEFRTSGYFLNNLDIQGKIHAVISIPKTVKFREKGYPELPRISRSIMIPDDAKMKFEIVQAEYETTFVAPIVPSKGHLLSDIDPKTVPYTFSDVYKTDTFWPKQVIELSEPFIIRDIRGITVRFNIFRYNAMRSQLITCKRIVVQVFTNGIDNFNVKTRHKGILTRDMIDTYDHFFLNFSHRIAGSLSKTSYVGIGEPGKMLIISANEFYNSMMPLRDWRTRKGHQTILVTCSVAGTTEGAIKTYIEGMYDTGVLFVLLVGEANLSDIPAKSVPSPNITPSDQTTPQDPTYALVGIPEDYFPDLYVSRISAENVEQVESQVMRILRYETNPATGSWFEQGCGIASSDWDELDDCDALRADLLSYGYTSVDQLYDITSPQPIINAINAGRGIVNYLGHGSSTEWGFNEPYIWPLFSVSDVQNLTSTNMLPFVFSSACQVGSFSEVSTCFAEAWLRSGTKENPKGAIAFFGSSSFVDPADPRIAQAEAVDLLVADAKTTVGGLCFNGICKMLEQSGSSAVPEAKTWHIFGDAATHIWTKTPMNFTSVNITDNGNSITVDAGISGSTICVSSGNNGTPYWNRIDDFQSYIFNTTNRPLYITITKHNYIPYTAVTGGTFTSNETWFGDLKVLGNVTFSTGTNLKILFGTSVLFNPNTKLTLNGSITVRLQNLLDTI